MLVLRREQDCKVVIAFLISPSEESIKSLKASSSLSVRFSESQIMRIRSLMAVSLNGLNRNLAHREVKGSMILDM